jgi:hypothetical protein
MNRAAKLSVTVLLLGVAAAAIYFRGLHEQILRLGRPQLTEEQARRQVTRAPLPAASASRSKAKLFWASTDSPGTLEAVEIELALDEHAAQRARQLLQALIEMAPSPAHRTLPAEAALLEFYLLKDGTAIADFSGELSTALPSGIFSERLAMESITRTLAENVKGITRLKLLIHGHESETLAGHLDLTGYFPVAAPPAENQREAKPAARLTPEPAPVKLND